MSSGLAWHPRHPDRQRPLRREDAVVQYSEPSPPTYVDEAEVLPGEVAAVEREFADAPTRRADAEAPLVDEVLQVPQKDQLRVAWPRTVLLNAAAKKRVGAQLAREREELLALQRAGLIDKEERAR